MQNANNALNFIFFVCLLVFMKPVVEESLQGFFYQKLALQQRMYVVFLQIKQQFVVYFVKTVWFVIIRLCNQRLAGTITT